MAASRDDFVIAIRSAFLKKSNKQRFSLIGLIFSSIVLIFLTGIKLPAINYLKSGISEVVYRVSFIASIPEKQFSKISLLINNHFQMYNEFEILTNKVKELQSIDRNNIFVISENNRLKKIVDDYIDISDELMAKVLLDKDSPFFKSIIVNRGSKDNVHNGMAVLDGRYLVGKIVETNYSTARVLLISDLNSKIPVIIEPGNIQSILSGTGKKKGKIQYLEEEYNLDKGNLVFTSGSGGIFKAGIPIGTIDENLSYSVVFFSDLSQLNFVNLVSYKKSNENVSK